MGQEGSRLCRQIIGTSMVQGGFKIHSSRWIQGWNHWCFGVYIWPIIRHQLSFGFLDTFHPERKLFLLANFDRQRILKIDMDERFQWISVKCGNKLRIGHDVKVIHFWMEHANLWDSFRLSLLDIEHLLLHGITIFGAVISRQVWRYGSLYSYFAVFRDFDVIFFWRSDVVSEHGNFCGWVVVFSLWLEIFMDFDIKFSLRCEIETSWGSCNYSLLFYVETPQSSELSQIWRQRALQWRKPVWTGERCDKVPLQREIRV